jgi:hypothetical protein
MPPENDEGRDDGIDRFWDQIVQNPSHPAGELEPADAATMRHLHAFDDRPGPNRDFRKRLRADLMHAHAIPVSSDPRSPLPLNQHTGHRQRASSVSPPRVSRRGGWALIQLATAALLLLTLGLGYLALRPSTPPDLRLAALPALTAEETLLDLPIPADMIPRGDAPGTGFIHYTLPPGTTTTWDSPALHVEYVISGTYTVRSDGSMQIVAAGEGGEPTSIPSGTEITLGPGDAMIAPRETISIYTTSGSDPVELLFWEVNEGDEAQTDPTPPGWMTHDIELNHQPPLPQGAGRLRLRRIELAAEEALSAPPDTLQLAVTLPENAAGTPTPDFIEHRITMNGSAIRNVGSEPTTVYVITLEPAATGTATP